MADLKCATALKPAGPINHRSKKNNCTIGSLWKIEFDLTPVHPNSDVIGHLVFRVRSIEMDL